MKRTCTLTAVLKSKLLPAFLVPALLLGGGGASAAVIISTWADGDSNWSNAGNWSPAQVPNNNATDQFIPIINNGSTVTLDISPTINGLAIDFFAPPASSLMISNGQVLTIASGGILINANVMGVNAPGTGVLVLGSGVTNFNAGTFLASGGGTFEVNGAGQTIDNSLGTITALNGSRAVIFGFGTTVSGGTLATAGTGVVGMSGFLVNLSGVTNTGTFAIPGSSQPASALRIAGTSTNTGTMGIFEAGAGVIVLAAGQALNNTGTLLASGGGTLELNGAGGTINNSSGTITALNGSRVVISGFGTTVSGGTLATAGTGVVGMSGFLVNLSGVTNTGTFAIPGSSQPASALRIAGTSTNTGTMGIFEPGLGVIALAAGQALNNAGTLLASGGGTLEVNMGGSGTVNNTGTLLASGGTLRLFNGGTVTNSGTVSIESGSELDIQGPTYVQTAGETNVNGVLSAAPTLVDIQGGTLSGEGLVIADVKNGGAVAPGNSPGILFVAGNYTQTSAGILDIEIAGLTAGSEYDQLFVFGDALLAGMLDVELVNGFVPTADAFFDILITGFFSPGSVFGTFDTVNLPTASNGAWDVSYLSDRVRVEFAVPEPSSLLLLGVGLLGMAFRRSKKVRTQVGSAL